MKEIRGTFDARGRRFAIVAAQFNDVVVSKLLDGAVAAFRSHGIAEDDLIVVWVPGAFELPLTARRLAAAGLHDAVVCLGAVVRGETAHFDYVADVAASGIREASADTGIPVVFGVLTTDALDQAMARAGGDHGNKGWDAAVAGLEMASLLERIGKGGEAR